MSYSVLCHVSSVHDVRSESWAVYSIPDIIVYELQEAKFTLIRKEIKRLSFDIGDFQRLPF